MNKYIINKINNLEVQTITEYRNQMIEKSLRHQYCVGRQCEGTRHFNSILK